MLTILLRYVYNGLTFCSSRLKSQGRSLDKLRSKIDRNLPSVKLLMFDNLRRKVPVAGRCQSHCDLASQDLKYTLEMEKITPTIFPTMQLGARDSAKLVTLSRGESIGLALDTEAGIISTIAASVILIILLVSYECFQIVICALKLFIAKEI